MQISGAPLREALAHLSSWSEEASCMCQLGSYLERRPAKSAIENFVRAMTDAAGPDFVPEDERIATFDQTERCGSNTRLSRTRFCVRARFRARAGEPEMEGHGTL